MIMTATRPTEAGDKYSGTYLAEASTTPPIPAVASQDAVETYLNII